MPINVKKNGINFNTGDGYNPTDVLFAGDVNESVAAWLDRHPEFIVPDNSLTYKKLVLGTLGFVTPEMYGAVGDGVTDDTENFQNALNSGIPVVATGHYKISSIRVNGNTLTNNGSINGTIYINNNALVRGGTIAQNTSAPCVVFESANAGKGYLNGALKDCVLAPSTDGTGIKFNATENPLFGFFVQNVDITRGEKSLWFYTTRWITKGSIENVYCHTPMYAIFIDNHSGENSSCGDIVLKNVYAQYYNGKPLSFFKVNNGNCMFTLDESFCYDGIGECVFDMSGSGGFSRIFIMGRQHNEIASPSFTNATSLREFFFLSQHTQHSPYIKHSAAEQLPKDYYGGTYFESFLSPAIPNSRFFGLISRGGTISGNSETNKVFGLSYYDGRLSLLRSTDGTIGGGNVVEVATPYSGNVYTTSTLPENVRDGAKCWCSDIKMDVTYYSGAWYKPDGTAIV